ncbi:MAG TPA: DUF1326 domain-containing protein [Gaiellaceae bacterium]|nr:DUF1326 domain-containing protein [Gaiellaceae bacterium]
MPTTRADYRIRGAYFESCNCEAICPCRMVGGVPGGRSTHGVCFGVLSWRIDEGVVGETGVGGLAAALVVSYDDDEAGSPWTVVLHVDARGDAAQQAAIAAVLLGDLGGPHVSKLPWVRKPRHTIGVRASTIALTPDGAGYRLEVGASIAARATRPVDTDLPVACGIPGYDRIGLELYADELVVYDGPFAWELSGNCAYATDFEYTSA